MTRAIQLDGAIEPEPYTDPSTGYDPDDPAIKAAFEEGRRKAREEMRAGWSVGVVHVTVDGGTCYVSTGSLSLTLVNSFYGTTST